MTDDATSEQFETRQGESLTSHEEPRAMNEELRSALEQVERSSQQLQTVSEELTTVNQKLKIKIDELSQANNNFQNLMNSTGIGTIFLDRNLRIRQFTPSIKETFNLTPSDLGRSLTDITSKVNNQHLLTDIEVVQDKLRTIERSAETTDGRTYMMRISPYRTLEDRIEGVVITLVDITEITKAREDLRLSGERLEDRGLELATANELLRVAVMERGRAESTKMDLLAQLVSAQEDERRRFALDLHDQLGQQLTSLRLKLESLEESGSQATKKWVAALLGTLKQLDSDVDFLAWKMRPVALDDLGLATALSNYVKHWSDHFGIPAEFRAGEIKGERLDPQIETNLYRIAQEALNNCAKHSKCSRADVLLERRDRNAVLIVEDDGRGFDEQAEGEGDHWGLTGMRERAALMGGTIEIESGPTQGTTIFVRVPLKAPPVKKTNKSSRLGQSS